jgi:hypothetical protein
MIIGSHQSSKAHPPVDEAAYTPRDWLRRQPAESCSGIGAAPKAKMEPSFPSEVAEVASQAELCSN